MTDFNELIENISHQTGAIDIAEAEFKRMLADDSDLRREYKDWCDEMGYTERKGFSDYAEEYISNREEKYDSLTDYDQ